MFTIFERGSPKGRPALNKFIFTVYILLSQKDKRTYVGQTDNFDNRLKRHNDGQVKATKYRRPLIKIFTETFDTRAKAMAREKWWKSGAGRRKLKELFEN